MVKDVWVVWVAPEEPEVYEPEVYLSRERARGRVEDILKDFVAAAKSPSMRHPRDEEEVGRWLAEVEKTLAGGYVEAATTVWNQFAAKFRSTNRLVRFQAGSLIQ